MNWYKIAQENIFYTSDGDFYYEDNNQDVLFNGVKEPSYNSLSEEEPEFDKSVQPLTRENFEKAIENRTARTSWIINYLKDPRESADKKLETMEIVLHKIPELYKEIEKYFIHNLVKYFEDFSSTIMTLQDAAKKGWINTISEHPNFFEACPSPFKEDEDIQEVRKETWIKRIINYPPFYETDYFSKDLKNDPDILQARIDGWKNIFKKYGTIQISGKYAFKKVPHDILVLFKDIGLYKGKI